MKFLSEALLLPMGKQEGVELFYLYSDLLQNLALT